MYLEQRLDSMQKQLEMMTSFVQMMMPNLTVRKEVMHFLQISRTTFNTYMNNGVFEEGIHYYYDDDKSIVFIPDEIIKLRASGMQRRVAKSKREKVNDVLAGMGIGA